MPGYIYQIQFEHISVSVLHYLNHMSCLLLLIETLCVLDTLSSITSSTKSVLSVLILLVRKLEIVVGNDRNSRKLYIVSNCQCVKPLTIYKWKSHWIFTSGKETPSALKVEKKYWCITSFSLSFSKSQQLRCIEIGHYRTDVQRNRHPYTFTAFYQLYLNRIW